MGGSGWSVEGMKKFNEIAKQVKMDRIRNGEDFNMQYKAFLEEEQNEKKQKSERELESIPTMISMEVTRYIIQMTTCSKKMEESSIPMICSQLQFRCITCTTTMNN